MSFVFRNVSNNKFSDVANLYKIKSSLEEFYKEGDYGLEYLCSNPCEGARKMVEKNLHRMNEACWYRLSLNPAGWAGEILFKNQDNVFWNALHRNNSFWAYKLIERTPEEKYYYYDFLKNVCFNTADWANEILKKNVKNIYHKYLQANPSQWLGDLLEDKLGKKGFDIDHELLSQNEGEWAGKILKQNIHSIDWSNLCQNPAEWAGEILEQYPEKIWWFDLSCNKAEWAGNWLEQNQDRINWYWLNTNPSQWAFELLEKNQDKIDAEAILCNEHLFTINYEFLKERMMRGFGEELMKERFHPRNMGKFEGWGFESGYSSDSDSDSDEE